MYVAYDQQSVQYIISLRLSVWTVFYDQHQEHTHTEGALLTLEHEHTTHRQVANCHYYSKVFCELIAILNLPSREICDKC